MLLHGLGNRRRLLVELEAALERATLAAPITLIFLDLDGFKLYNDVFGHAAGDTLLSRLAAKLTKTVEKIGAAYRMGGDEFCVLLQCDATTDRRLMSSIVKSLSGQGDGFRITSSQGAVLLPQETSDVSQALRIADERMYRQKNGRPGSVITQTADVISSIVSERTPDLHEHALGVTELALAFAVNLGLTGSELDELAHAAKLHDVGKMAIPEEILTKPSSLSEDEWAFMRRHTLIGERILKAAPALQRVAALVRSTHERWDGAGYPDGLSGEDIPLASRIIFICDSFDAMTTERPYHPALSVPAALAEPPQLQRDTVRPRSRGHLLRRRGWTLGGTAWSSRERLSSRPTRTRREAEARLTHLAWKRAGVRKKAQDCRAGSGSDRPPTCRAARPGRRADPRAH